jgi:small GTP-binding protein
MLHPMQLHVEARPFKLVLLGDAGVGKTSIVNRRCYNDFSPSLPATVGLSNQTITVQVKGEKIDLRIWDTAGQEQYSALIPMFSRDADVGVLVAAADRPDTIESLSRWADLLSDSGSSNGMVPPAIVAVNKTDLVSNDDQSKTVTELLDRFTHVHCVSAFTGAGIELMFQAAAVAAREFYHSSRAQNDPIPEPPANQSSGCCNVA